MIRFSVVVLVLVGSPVWFADLLPETSRGVSPCPRKLLRQIDVAWTYVTVVVESDLQVLPPTITVMPEPRLLRAIAEKIFCNKTLSSDYDRSVAKDFSGLGNYMWLEKLEPAFAILRSLLSMEQKADALAYTPDSAVHLSGHHAALRREASTLLSKWGSTRYESLARLTVEHVSSVLQGAQSTIDWDRVVVLHTKSGLQTCDNPDVAKRSVLDVAAAFRDITNLKSKLLAYYPVDGVFLSLLRYGAFTGILDGDIDVVDFDLEFVLEVSSVASFTPVAVALARALGRRNWFGCSLSHKLYLTCSACGRGFGGLDVYGVVRTGTSVVSGRHGKYGTSKTGIPLHVIHPLRTCLAYNTTFPCIRDPLEFYTLWKENEYAVDSYCLALPKYSAEKHLISRYNNYTWLKEGIQSRHIEHLQKYWAQLEAAGGMSFSQVWENSPACVEAREQIKRTGRLQGATLGSEGEKWITTLGADTLKVPPLSKSFRMFLENIDEDGMSTSERTEAHHQGASLPYHAPRRLVMVLAGSRVVESPQLQWWKFLLAGTEEKLHPLPDEFFFTFLVLIILVRHLYKPDLKAVFIKVPMSSELVKSVHLATLEITLFGKEQLRAHELPDDMVDDDIRDQVSSLITRVNASIEKNATFVSPCTHTLKRQLESLATRLKGGHQVIKCEPAALRSLRLLLRVPQGVDVEPIFRYGFHALSECFRIAPLTPFIV